MAKKSKKQNQLELKIIGAEEIDYYLNNKFELSNDDFWFWFFEDCPKGESNLLENNENVYPELFRNYVKLIIQEFQEDADDDGILEIENNF
jgi:hypothetical protein